MVKKKEPESLLDSALEDLDQIRFNPPSTDLKRLADNLAITLAILKIHRGEGFGPDLRTGLYGRSAYEAKAEHEVLVFAQTVRTSIPKYDQPVFKCLGDYDKCRAPPQKRGRWVCVPLLIACIAERFTKIVSVGGDDT